MAKPILIALDYDDTYTKDPELWLQFIKLASSRGHTVICATMRSSSERDDMDPRLLDAVNDVQFTNSAAKRITLANRSIRPDIWIDDRPEWIVGDAF